MPESFQYIEKEILLRVSKGDEYAFRAMFDKYRDIVFSIAFKITRVNTAAEDAVQDVFIKIWVNRQKLPMVKNFGAYLNTITCNYVYDALRKIACENVYLNNFIIPETVSEDTLNIIKFNELNKFMLEAVKALPVQQRNVYQLSRVKGMKYDEIAAHLNVARSTVNTHMVEALHFIKTYLRSNEIIALLFLLFRIL